ncbi:MAG TPA: hypothetical protein VMF91_07350 [Bryobacteraceae bacterium]|nr:hypothetical protein [Bryobacteraceae bacterium]
MSSKKSPIDAINEFDNFNFEQIKKGLGAATLLPDDVLNLYEMHAGAVAPYLATAPKSQRYSGALYFVCRKHLALGATALFRVYSAQTFRETRAAVEAAGIAYAIRDDPEKFKIFAEDDGTEPRRRAARNAFKSHVIFPKTIPKLALLKEFYDTASELSHTNLTSFLRHLSRDNPKPHRFSYQDFQPKDINRDLPKTLFWLCDAHLAILMAADLVFPDIPEGHIAAFKKERQYVFERVHRFHEAHGDSISAARMLIKAYNEQGEQLEA